MPELRDKQPVTVSNPSTSTQGDTMKVTGATKTPSLHDEEPLQVGGGASPAASVPASGSSSILDRWDEAMDYKESMAIDGFRPVREELEVLARDWAKTRLNISLDQFFSGQAMASDCRLRRFADRRLRRLCQAIGEEAIDAVISEVEQEKRKEMSEKYWRVFVGEATEEEEARVFEEIDNA